MADRSKGDATGRILGALVFVLGIAVIVIVLLLAYRLFLDPSVAMHVPQGREPTFVHLAAGFADLLIRVLLLTVGSISGALIATRGIRMYEASLTPSAASDTPKE